MELAGGYWEREVATGLGMHWARLGRPEVGKVEDRADGLLGESRVVLVKRLCYSEALRLGGTGAGRFVCVGVSGRGTVVQQGKRAEEAW